MDALASAFGGASALLKHEVAYVLGQMQVARAVQELRYDLHDLVHKQTFHFFSNVRYFLAYLASVSHLPECNTLPGQI